MFAQEHTDLVEFCRGCRQDMHEPDEQGVKVIAIVGDHLDNATGNHIDVKCITEGYQEYVVVLQRFSETEGFSQCRVNLANLIAFARLANHAKVESV